MVNTKLAKQFNKPTMINSHSHSHLDFDFPVFDQDRDEILQRCNSTGLTKVFSAVIICMSNLSGRMPAISVNLPQKASLLADCLHK